MGRACPTCTPCDWCKRTAGAPCRLGCTRLLGADGGYDVVLELEADPATAPTELDLGLLLDAALVDWEAAA
jgi:hypothetical protein